MDGAESTPFLEISRNFLWTVKIYGMFDRKEAEVAKDGQVLHRSVLPGLELQHGARIGELAFCVPDSSRLDPPYP